MNKFLAPSCIIHYLNFSPYREMLLLVKLESKPQMCYKCISIGWTKVCHLFFHKHMPDETDVYTASDYWIRMWRGVGWVWMKSRGECGME